MSWKFDEAKSWFWGGGIVNSDRVYAPSLDGRVYALDRRSGELDWAVETEGSVIGAPVIVSDRLAIASTDGRVRVVDLIDGQGERHCDIRNEIRTSLVSSNDFVLLSATDHSIRALKIKSSGNPDEEWVHFSNKDGSIESDWIRSC